MVRLFPRENCRLSIEETLRSVLDASPVSTLDLEFGDARAARIRLRYDNSALAKPVSDDRVFLTASITKPVVTMHAIQMLADGAFALNDRVGRFLPEFDRAGLRRICIRHLLTHTSGLPDMLPDNEALRASHAANSDFVRRTADITPDFPVATDCRYSSMGFAVLAALIEHITGDPLRTSLKADLLTPLGMSRTSLGLSDEQFSREPGLPCELPAWQPADSDWNWNSRYWRTLGAPWGGLLSTVSDLGRFARSLLGAWAGSQESAGVLSPSASRTALTNQIECYPDLSDSLRRTRAWGFGWRLNWPDHAACFCDLLPPDAAGHWGATGTLLWIDPASSRYAVLLTTTPYEVSGSTLQRLSNVLVATDC